MQSPTDQTPSTHRPIILPQAPLSASQALECGRPLGIAHPQPRRRRRVSTESVGGFVDVDEEIDQMFAAAFVQGDAQHDGAEAAYSPPPSPGYWPQSPAYNPNTHDEDDIEYIVVDDDEESTAQYPPSPSTPGDAAPIPAQQPLAPLQRREQLDSPVGPLTQRGSLARTRRTLFPAHQN